MNGDFRHDSKQGPELMCSHAWVMLWMAVCVWGGEGERKGRRQTVVAKPRVLPSTLWNQESVTCFLKVGVNPVSSGGCMLPSLCQFGVQAFNRFYLHCQSCKKKIAVQFCAPYFVYVKPVVMFDFCGKNNLKEHRLHQTACKEAQSILQMRFPGLALVNLSASKKYRQRLYFFSTRKLTWPLSVGSMQPSPPSPHWTQWTARPRLLQPNPRP